MSTFKSKISKHLIYVLCFTYVIVYHVTCTSFQVKEGVFLSPHRQYTINIPEEGWDIVRLNDEDITLQHKKHQATIILISSDLEGEKASLKSLDERLFIGIKGRNVLLKETVIVSNKQAIHTILEFRINEQRLKMNSYVIKVRDRVFDLVYWAPPDTFGYGQNDFEDMVGSFKLLEQ